MHLQRRARDNLPYVARAAAVQFARIAAMRALLAPGLAGPAPEAEPGAQRAAVDDPGRA
ncbi:MULTISPECIES: hypothetical protein [Sorangium]|uniref:hypothetical protein n=1 Tax=Sorangium TaxID=39643 RepID=UPI003D9C3BB0